MLCYQLLNNPVKDTLSLEIIRGWLSIPEYVGSWWVKLVGEVDGCS